MEIKEKMSPEFAVFNCHVNNAEKRAIKLFKKKYGELIYRATIKKIRRKGIMTIFHKPLNAHTLYFVKTITRFVNEDRK